MDTEIERERERDKRISYEELAHMIMEAQRSYSLLSASWRSRGADSVVQAESEGLRTRSTDGPIPRAGEDHMMAPQQSGTGSKFPLPPLFCSIQAFN